MSVSHPLIRELKESTRELLLWSLGGDTKQDIDDTCSTLSSLCANLESILVRGLLPRRTLFGTQQPEPWQWLEELAQRPGLPYSFQSAVSLARKSPKVATARGKLRLSIRACLRSGCLHVPVQTLLHTGEHSIEYRGDSVLGDAILAEILLSVLLQLSRLPFKPALANARFLDTTWQLPKTVQLELLPCTAIGLSLDFIVNLAVVVSIAPGSVADDTEVIAVGDVVDEINGVVICSKTRGNLKDIMRRGAKLPVIINIVKLHPEDGDAYGPLDSVISNSRVGHVISKAVKCRRHDKMAATDSDEKAVTCPKTSAKQRARLGLPAIFEGVTSTGRMGSINSIDMAFRQVPRCDRESNQRLHRVTFECREVGVRVVDVDSAEVLLSHSYMEISACGKSPRWPLRFAYIAGDDSPNCNRASSFSCYVFQGENTRDVDALMQGIGQGFARTHFAV